MEDLANQEQEPLPPGYDENDPGWEKGPSSRENRRGIPEDQGGSGGKSKGTGESWWHPEEGEYRRHEDKNHDPHWDHNEWNEWTSPWENVDDDGNPIDPGKPSATVDPVSGKNPIDCT